MTRPVTQILTVLRVAHRRRRTTRARLVTGVVAMPLDARMPFTDELYGRLRSRAVELHGYTARTALRSPANILHIHWPEAHASHRDVKGALLDVARFLSVISLLRLLGYRVIWFVHNLQSHERRHPALERALMSAFRRLCDGYVFMTRSSQDVAEARRWPRRPVCDMPLTLGRARFGPAVARPIARTQLAIPADAHVVLLLGQLRSYKGVADLLGLAEQATDLGITIVIAGRSKEPELVAALSAAATQGNIRWFDGYVPDDRIASFFSMADLFVLPFREINSSASALLALSYRLRVVAPDHPTMREMARRFGAEWFDLFSGELSAEHLREALDAPPPAHAPAERDGYDWDEAVRRLYAFHSDVAGRRHRYCRST